MLGRLHANCVQASLIVFHCSLTNYSCDYDCVRCLFSLCAIHISTVQELLSVLTNGGGAIVECSLQCCCNDIHYNV